MTITDITALKPLKLRIHNDHHTSYRRTHLKNRGCDLQVHSRTLGNPNNLKLPSSLVGQLEQTRDPYDLHILHAVG